MTNLLTIPLLALGVALVILLLALATGRNWRDPELPGVALRWGLGPMVGVLWLLLFVAVVLSLFKLLAAPLPDNTGGDSGAYRFHFLALVGLMTALAGLVGFPLALLRVWTTERATKATEEGLITDRINKAVANLGADKESADSQGRKIMIPNIEVRLGGLLALERIAQDSPRDHVQVMEILCAYLRENAPATEAIRSPHEVFLRLTSGSIGGPALGAEAAFQHSNYRESNKFFGWNPTELNHATLEEWAETAFKPRTDIQIAATIIGRRSNRQRETEKNYKVEATNRLGRFDLRSTNLQGLELGGDFSRFDFSFSRFDGALLEGRFHDCMFVRSSFQGARCVKANFTESDFSAANLSSACMIGAKLNGCRLWYCHMDHTNLNNASVSQADLYEAKVEHAYCYDNSNFSYSRIMSSSIEQLKGINEGLTRNLFIVGGSDEGSGLEHPASLDRRAATMSELEFKKFWLSYLAVEGLSHPTFSDSYRR